VDDGLTPADGESATAPPATGAGVGGGTARRGVAARRAGRPGREAIDPLGGERPSRRRATQPSVPWPDESGADVGTGEITAGSGGDRPSGQPSGQPLDELFGDERFGDERFHDDLDTALHRGPVVLPAIVPAEALPEGGEARDRDGTPVAAPAVTGPMPLPKLAAYPAADDLIVAPSALTPEPVRPVVRSPGARRVRRVTRVVRHVDTWSVFKVALVFNVFLYVVLLTSGVLLWQVAQNTGTIDNVERFFETFGWQTFELHGGEIYHNAWVAGLFLVVGLTGLAVLLATLFNLITDLVGGIRVSVLEEEVVARDERGTNPNRMAVLSRLERFGRGGR
jgi:hypothetical protein